MKKLSIGIFAHVDAGKTTLTGIKTMKKKSQSETDTYKEVIKSLISE